MNEDEKFWRETDEQFEKIMKEFERKNYVHSILKRCVTDYYFWESAIAFVCVIVWITLVFVLDCVLC